MDLNLNNHFGRFAGLEVPITETPHKIGETEAIEYSFTNPDDPVVAGMYAAAQEMGLRLRLKWPGLSMGDHSYRGNRINASIEKAEDGKWRVANNFHFG